jgi:acyl-CoA synthetase (AMP-forming)/AMP-acid ligase II
LLTLLYTGLADLPLKITLPASLALLSYLDGRWNIRHDLRFLKNVLTGVLGGKLKERSDNLNVFYQLEAHAQKSPDRVFLIFQGKKWTYKEAYEKALKYGTWFKTRFGIVKNEVVAMNFMNGDLFIWVWFGLWSIGAKPAFINYNLLSKPLLHSVQASGTRLMVVEEEIYNTFDEATLEGFRNPNFREDGGPIEVVKFTPGVEAEVEATLGKREPNSARNGQLLKDMSILIYTSGTTGLPKPAIISWAKAAASPALVYRWLGIKPDDVFYTAMPLYHSSGSILGCLMTLSAGATFSLGRKFQRKGFWEDVKSSNATAIQYIGETLRYLMSVPPSPDDNNHKVRLAFGNGLRPDVWPNFKERFGIEQIAEFYAATEAPSALFNVSKNKFTEGAVGVNGKLVSLLMGSTSVVVEMDFEENTPIRDKKTGLLKPVPAGSPGELLFKLDPADIEQGFQGYYKNKGATSKKILRDVLAKGDAYFSTGDIMRKDDEGRWFFCDRIGDTFRWKSENVSTAEVAEILGQKPHLLEEANVYGVTVPSHDGRAGCCAVILTEDHHQNFQSSGAVDQKLLAEVAEHAQKHLPRYAVPIFLRIIADGGVSNRTGTNKQQKTGLRDEGIELEKVHAKGDHLYWLPPGSKTYVRFHEDDHKKLSAGQLKL